MYGPLVHLLKLIAILRTWRRNEKSIKSGKAFFFHIYKGGRYNYHTSLYKEQTGTREILSVQQ